VTILRLHDPNDWRKLDPDSAAETAAMMIALALALAAVLAFGIWVALRLTLRDRRDDSLRDLLDGADALERQLHDCRERMKKLQALLAQLPSDMTRPALAALDPDGQVKTALRDVLAHRLWIQQNGETASQRQLDEALDAIKKSREQLSEQLRKLDEVGNELAAAGAELKAAYSLSASRKRPAGPPRKLNGHAAPDA
jgi:prefoldin subunit 5